LEANKKVGNQVNDQFDVVEAVGEKVFFYGGHSEDYFVECEGIVRGM